MKEKIFILKSEIKNDFKKLNNILINSRQHIRYISIVKNIQDWWNLRFM